MPNIFRINTPMGVLYRILSDYLPKLECYADWGRDNYPHRGVYLDFVPHNILAEGCYTHSCSKSS